MLRTTTKKIPKIGPLPRYRLFCANRTSGHLELDRQFQATNDAAAVGLAEDWRDDRGAELWRSYRVVKHWRA